MQQNLKIVRLYAHTNPTNRSKAELLHMLTSRPRCHLQKNDRRLYLYDRLFI